MSLAVRCALGVLLSVTSAGGLRAHAQERSSRQLASYLVSGWRGEREKLVSGKVRLVGVERKGNRQSTRSITYSFDRLLGSIKSHVTRDGVAEGVWLLTPEYLAQCALNSSPVVSLQNPTDSKSKLDFVKDLDPRCLGMNLIGDYDAPPPFEEVIARLNRYQLVKVSQPTKETHEVEWSRATDRMSVRYVSVLNPSAGFSCERYQVLTQRKGDEGWLSASKSTAQWAQRNGVWVPERVTLEGLGDHRVQLTLAWEKVNEPLPDDEFQIDRLGVPKGALIADNRLSPQTPIVVGRAGHNALVPPPPTAASPFSLLRPWTVFVAGAVVLAGVGWLFFVRRRRRGAALPR